VPSLGDEKDAQMSHDQQPDGEIGAGVSAGSMVTTMLDYLERKQAAPTPDESDMLAELVLAIAERMDHAPMDEVITVLGMLPGLSLATRAKLESRFAA
jgi:hypothetical protein